MESSSSDWVGRSSPTEALESSFYGTRLGQEALAAQEPGISEAMRPRDYRWDELREVDLAWNSDRNEKNACLRFRQETRGSQRVRSQDPVRTQSINKGDRDDKD